MPIGSVDWIAEGMLVGPFDDVGDGWFEVPVRNQFFHGAHPLGWVRDIGVTVDGSPGADLHLVVREQPVPLALVRATSDIWWYPREIARLRFRLPGAPLEQEVLVQCWFAVSTFFFTPEIDRHDHYPTMRLDLEEQMPHTTTGSRS